MERQTEVSSTTVVPRYYGYDEMIPQEVIEAAVRKVVEGFRPERVIMFGSYAYGQPHVGSDVDLFIVMDTALRPNPQAVAIRRYVRFPFDVDLIVRTPAMVEERLKIGDPFIHQIVEQGKVLYERPC